MFQKFFTKKEVVDLEKLQDQAELSFVTARFDWDLYNALAEKGQDMASFYAFVQEQRMLSSAVPVPLGDEIRRLAAYVALFQTAQPADIYCKFDNKVPNDDAHLIAPLLLLPLVQNALYLGYNTMAIHPIRVRLSLVGDQLKLEVSNRVNHYLATQQQNERLRLWKARLDVLFGEDYDLLFNSNSNLFKATLGLRLDAVKLS